MTSFRKQVKGLAPLSSPKQGYLFGSICTSDYIRCYLGETKLNELQISLFHMSTINRWLASDISTNAVSGNSKSLLLMLQ